MNWTREDVQEALVYVVGGCASVVALVAVFLLGLALLRDIGR